MTETSFMRADEIANGFNSVNERRYWKASIAGSRLSPEVHFNSRASMVCVNYRIDTDDFTVVFSKTSASFGDFLASAYRSLGQVLNGLKAAGLPFAAPLSDAAPGPLLRLEYSPGDRQFTAHLARMGDEWQDTPPAPFKVPERKNDESAFSGVDEL